MWRCDWGFAGFSPSWFHRFYGSLFQIDKRGSAELRDCLRGGGATHTAVVLSSRTLLCCTSGQKVLEWLGKAVTGHP